MSEIRFLYTYLLFICFYLLILTLGAPSFLPEETRQKIENITGNITAEVPRGWWEDIPVIGPVYGFLKGVYDGLSTLWILLTVSSTVRWITIIIITPFVVTLFYIILRLIRGGG